MSVLPIIIDTDPGIDDAAALVLALKNPSLDVRLITTVVGNVDVEKTTANTLKLLSFLNEEIPVAKGAREPLLRPYEDAAYAHGESGMDGYDFPKHTKEPLKSFAVEAMRDELLKSKEKITIVAIGALTNIALLIKQYPECLDKIEEIVIMGGSISVGNTTSAAEFNIYADPHAAQIVFQSKLPLTMIGLDVTTNTLLTKRVVMEIKDANEVGNMLYQLFSHYRGGSIETGLRMHDACTIYYLLHRGQDTIKTEDYYIEICTEGVAMGATVADIRHAYHGDKTNCTVGLSFDIDDFNDWFLDEIKNL